MGVLLRLLGPDDGSADAIKGALGKKIIAFELKENNIKIRLEGIGELVITDEGQSCCETRWISTDDDLGSVVGGNLLEINIVDAGEPTVGKTDDVHEMQFLNVKTSRGVIVFQTHNEHNGYYGGFSIAARLVKE